MSMFVPSFVGVEDAKSVDTIEGFVSVQVPTVGRTAETTEVPDDSSSNVEDNLDINVSLPRDSVESSFKDVFDAIE